MKINEKVDRATVLVAELLPLLEALTRKKVSPQRRNDLRTKTGSGQMFRLARASTALSSETALLANKAARGKGRK